MQYKTLIVFLIALNGKMAIGQSPYQINWDKEAAFLSSGIGLNAKLTKSARYSFFSGHTSSAAAMSFFTAKVFSDYFPDSKWKPLVWTMAATLPALTGYFRIKGGKHYPTDVIMGYTVGALIGFFVPYIHQTKWKPKKEQDLSFRLQPTGISLRWRL